ncbi:TetR/AcrR family transcriptional regulator [Micromonospora sediminimaris]|uniref:TetR family transcriptional regulator n=1 Tax=Micromonospora sediminimaris TaxID=547162 RepID=A0A9W5XN48_9ACTN|nr:TetR/AcrR family transcriptional regulator [Micromonospora sediminimaris]GIJ36183.1 TetR family transcriptional regulator [Micromonospora sediminimaris]SFB85034.1 transcriptional regulator, TetR family [Micromonospora sediminimaris]
MTDSGAEIPARRGTRTKPALTRQAIVGAALDLVDRAGVDAVTMRSVADRLGTGPASIYRHVTGKDELLELVLDRVLAEVAVPPPHPEDWRGPLIALAREVRRVLLAHNDIAAVAMSGPPVGGNPARIAEALLAILRTAGFPDQVCAWAVDRLSLYVTADALDTARQRVMGHDGPAAAQRRWAQVAQYYRDLPADRFPHTVALRDALFADGPVDRFTLGLELFLDGLAARRNG